MQRRHRSARPIDMPRAGLREALKQLASLVRRKRKPANVPGAARQLV